MWLLIWPRSRRLVANVPGITALDVAKLLSDTAVVKGTTEAAVNAAPRAAEPPPLPRR